MDDLPCPARLEAKDEDGKVWFYLCNHPDAGPYKNQVKRAMCEVCPVRTNSEEPTFRAEVLPDGTIVYERKPGDWEPPRDHKGYRRKSNDPKSDDAWVFIPDWPQCPNRSLNTQRKTGCGCLLVEMTCKDRRSPSFGKEVELETCQECTLIRRSNGP
jgi:hypothetical protein